MVEPSSPFLDGSVNLRERHFGCTWNVGQLRGAPPGEDPRASLGLGRAVRLQGRRERACRFTGCAPRL
eukprot:10197333-Alexandrium_andersonii.AAC.1